MRQLFRRVLTTPLILLAALLIFIEEVLWEWLKSVTAYCARLPAIARFERWIAAQSPFVAVAIFAGIDAVVFFVKLRGVFLMTEGHFWLGLIIIIAAKVIATALIARLFVLTKPKLMSVRWFAWLHDAVVRVKDWVYARLQTLSAWQQAKAFVAQARAWMRSGRPGMILSRWRAIFRRRRRT